jgi:DNA-directed RNA polymerase subunit K/omega
MAEAQVTEAQEPASFTPAPPITGRFLFVDVAARRAKQLRRGALPRLGQDGDSSIHPIKAERVAMEEVRRGLVHYEVPPVKNRADEIPA